MSTVTVSSSVSPMRRPCVRRDSASPVGSRRDSVSPCSSRSTMAWCSSRRRRSDPAAPADAPSAILRNRSSTSRATNSGVVAARRSDGLDRPSAGDGGEQLLLGGAQVAVARDRLDELVDDAGIEGRAARGHGPHGVDQLVALGDAILEQVAVAGRPFGQQRDRVLGVVELAEDHDAGARVQLADHLGRLDPLALEARRHADVGDDHLRCRRIRAGHEAVVVGGLAHDLDVGVPGRAAPGPRSGRAGCRRRGRR